MAARIKQARRYLREADNALHHIEVVPVRVLQAENVADVILQTIIGRSRNHQLPNGNAH